MHFCLSNRDRKRGRVKKLRSCVFCVTRCMSCVSLVRSASFFMLKTSLTTIVEWVVVIVMLLLFPEYTHTYSSHIHRQKTTSMRFDTRIHTFLMLSGFSGGSALNSTVTMSEWVGAERPELFWGHMEHVWERRRRAREKERERVRRKGVIHVRLYIERQVFHGIRRLVCVVNGENGLFAQKWFLRLFSSISVSFSLVVYSRLLARFCFSVISHSMRVSDFKLHMQYRMKVRVKVNERQTVN